MPFFVIRAVPSGILLATPVNTRLLISAPSSTGVAGWSIAGRTVPAERQNPEEAKPNMQSSVVDMSDIFSFINNLLKGPMQEFYFTYGMQILCRI